MQNIKIGWKEGAGLFVFLIISGLYFFGTQNLSGVLDYKYAYYYEELIGFFSRVILPAPFLVGVFLLSTHKTEKRIREGKFNFRKLSFFSLAISLMTGLLWTLQIILGPDYGYASFDVIRPLFDGTIFPVAPMVLVFLFSFIPSLLLYKFYLHPKRFYITTIIFFIFLFFGLFTYQQVSVKTCNFNYDEFCLSKKAINENNPSLCDKAKGNNLKKICHTLIERHNKRETEGAENWTIIRIDGKRYYEGYIKKIYYSFVLDSKEHFMTCNELPSTNKVWQVMDEHQNIIQKIENINPGSIFVTKGDYDDCVDKSDIVISYPSHQNKLEIEKIINGKTFFNIPYRLQNQ